MTEYAYPLHETETSHAQNGMTLRDWFAGQALAALISKSPFFDSTGELGKSIDLVEFWADMANSAYVYADAMLEARK